VAGRGPRHRVPAPARRASRPLEEAHALLREQAPRFENDRYFAPAIERAAAMVHAGSLARSFRAIRGLPALWTPA